MRGLFPFGFWRVFHVCIFIKQQKRPRWRCLVLRSKKRNSVLGRRSLSSTPSPTRCSPPRWRYWTRSADSHAAHTCSTCVLCLLQDIISSHVACLSVCCACVVRVTVVQWHVWTSAVTVNTWPPAQMTAPSESGAPKTSCCEIISVWGPTWSTTMPHLSASAPTPGETHTHTYYNYGYYSSFSQI